MIVEDDDGTTFSFRGGSVKFGTVRINGMPEEEFKKMSGDEVDYPESDWRHEVVNGDTKLGYDEWRKHRREAEDEVVRDLVSKTCRRASLAEGVYDLMLDKTDTFEGEIGVDLAYLMGAILKGEKFEAWLGASDGLMRKLVASFDPDNAVWDYVDLMNDDGDVAFPERIKAAILAGDVGNLDEEDYPQAGAWVDVLKVGAS